MSSYQQRALVEETAKISHSSLKDVNWQVKVSFSFVGEVYNFWTVYNHRKNQTGTFSLLCQVINYQL